MNKVWQFITDFWGELWNHNGNRSNRDLVVPIYRGDWYRHGYEVILEAPIDRDCHAHILKPITFTNEEITSLYTEGYTLLEVAKMTNNTYHKVRNIAHKEGVVRKKGVKYAS